MNGSIILELSREYFHFLFMDHRRQWYNGSSSKYSQCSYNRGILYDIKFVLEFTDWTIMIQVKWIIIFARLILQLSTFSYILALYLLTSAKYEIVFWEILGNTLMAWVRRSVVHYLVIILNLWLVNFSCSTKIPTALHWHPPFIIHCFLVDWQRGSSSAESKSHIWSSVIIFDLPIKHQKVLNV